MEEEMENDPIFFLQTILKFAKFPNASSIFYTKKR